MEAKKNYHDRSSTIQTAHVKSTRAWTTSIRLLELERNDIRSFIIVKGNEKKKTIAVGVLQSKLPHVSFTMAYM